MSSSARDQVARLLAMVPYLQSRSEVSLSQVATEFGVTPAQVRKDLAVLWMCGLPGLTPDRMIDVDMEAIEEDPDGVVRIDNADFLARPVRLGSSEAAALMVALRALRESSPEESREVVDRVLAKLEEATAAGPLPAVEVRMPRTRTPSRHAPALRAAIRDDRQVRLDYYVPARDETTERVVDPVAVLTRDDHDYLDAWCHLAAARRLFRLDRVEQVQPLDAARSRPDLEPRDLASGLFEPGPDDLVAVLRLEPWARWFAEYYPVDDVRALPDDRCEVTLRVADRRWLVRLALRLGPAAEIVSPPALRAQVREAAAASLALYER